MITDANKGITAITYDHLNLPTQITMGGGTISYIYDATGMKLRKTVGSSVTDYAGNHVYEDGNLQFFNHPEGYVTPDGSGGYDYVYQYKDHLGNVRLSYMNNNGTTEIVEENNYYPFGLKQKGYNSTVSSLGNSVAQRWKFGGKEYDDTFGLETYDFGARNYDPALGRWMNIDPLAEDMRRHSPYNYAFNNPISFIDPDGMKPWWINNEDGTWTAEAGDSAATLAQDAGISMERANEIVESQLGPNYIGEDGELKSNVDVGDVVDIPETDTLSDEEFNESFLSGRNQDLGDPKVEVVDINDDGKLDAGVVDGDTPYFNFDGKGNFFNKTVTPDKIAPAIGNQILKRILGKAGGSLLSSQKANQFEDGLLERRDLGLPGTASQRQVDSVKIVRFMMQLKRADSLIAKD